MKQEVKLEPPDLIIMRPRGVLEPEGVKQMIDDTVELISAKGQAKFMIDITEPMVDSSVANHLMKTIASVRLLGSDCVIAGIRPEVARTIVALGVDLPDIKTYSDLSEALKRTSKVSAGKT